jgi:AcrR family transcriptional regulator
MTGPLIGPNRFRTDAGSLALMADDVKTSGRRRYVSAMRTEQAARTRRAVLQAAQELFAEQGYATTSVSQIAARAGVAVDTVYAAAGRKPALLRELVETALSGTDTAVPAEQRGYVKALRAAATAREKIAIYAGAVAEIQARLAPAHRALAEASVGDPELAALRAEIAERRAGNMRLLAADLRATGELRPDLTDQEVADIVWSMNAAEYHALLVGERGWSTERFALFLTDAWTRLLLA